MTAEILAPLAILLAGSVLAYYQSRRRLPRRIVDSYRNDIAKQKTRLDIAIVGVGLLLALEIIDKFF